MDRTEHFRELIKKSLQEIYEYLPEEEGIRNELILDDINHHYELLQIGWEGPRRIHGSVVHCDIRDGKIYLEHNGTDFDIVEDWLDEGVKKSEIVLGSNPPYLRQHTKFALA